MQRLLENIAKIKRAARENNDGRIADTIARELKQLSGLDREELSKGPTCRQIKEYATQIMRERPGMKFEEAWRSAAQEMIPITIQSLLQELPGDVEHKSGDSFYPDMFYKQGKIVARGNLDEDLIYHLWHPEMKADFDLFRQDDLGELIQTISMLSEQSQRVPVS